MSKPATNLRLFVGIYPPQSRALLETLNGLTLPPHRVVPAEQLHLTVHFIGDVPLRDVDRTVESVARSAAGLASFALRPLELISLPRRGRARLVAIETDRPAPLLEIQRRLVTRLARRVRSRPGDRFLPHLTLCRFSRPADLQRIEQPVKMDAFDVPHIRIMRSTLSHEGAVHHELDRIELGT
jgi:2'-5' RNA ligase